MNFILFLMRKETDKNKTIMSKRIYNYIASKNEINKKLFIISIW